MGAGVREGEGQEEGGVMAGEAYEVVYRRDKYTHRNQFASLDEAMACARVMAGRSSVEDVKVYRLPTKRELIEVVKPAAPETARQRPGCE